jgi:hypothetical protein
MRRFWTDAILAISLCGASALAQSIPMSPQQAPNIAPTGPTRQQSGGQRQPAPGTVKATPTTLPGVQPLYQGTIEGYVYWDTGAVQHNPASACSGLAVTVSVGTAPSGSTPTFEQFTPLGTFNNLTYLNNGSTLGACAYSMKVPIGQDLQVQVSIAPSTFSQPVAPATPPTANNASGPIRIIGGKCNNLPPAVPSAAVLGSRWWTCGNYAYNVNFVLQSSGSSLLMSAGGNQGLLSGQPQQGSKNPGPAGMLTGGSMPAAQMQGSLATQGNSAGPQQMQTKASAIQGNKQSTNQAVAGQKPLTNADVVKMVRSGIPESVIVSSVQSAGKNFNFSPDGCRGLKQARVSANVLSAMGDGSVQPCVAGTVGGAGGKVADDLNPQPYPPGRKPVDPALQSKLGPSKSGSLVKNPLATRVNAATIAVLQKQRSAADLEASQMKLSVRPATQTAMNGGPSQLMSATGNGGTATISQSASAAALSNAGSSGGATGPVKISPAVTHLNNVNATVVICSNDPTFRILSVSGSASPATFTPIDQFNLYTITGCSFGNPGNADKVYIYGAGNFRGNFTINFWSDNSLVVALDESISGYPDLSNINLVVQRNDGQQTEKQGFNFYAARQKVALGAIPSSWANLATFTTGFKTMTPQYFSPASTSSYSPRPSGTAFVSRFYDGQKFDPTVQTDTVDWYDFSHLAPGFTTDSFQVTTFPQNCPYVVTYRQDFGTWRWYWGNGSAANNIYIFPADTTCSGFNADSMVLGIPMNVYQNWTGSYYALQVWVNGPRGIDPMTNQPISQ